MQAKLIHAKQVPFQVAIIGLGPKGLYALERLIAQVQQSNVNRLIEVHLFNRTSFFGSGDIYRSDQPSFLLMNYANHNIQFKNKNAPNLQTEHLPDFLAWLAKREHKKIEDIQYEYSPRAVVGSFLEHCFQFLLKQLPANLKVQTHVATVVDIVPEDDAYKIIINEKNQANTVNKILLTTGHFWNRQNTDSAEENNTFVDFIYPVAQKLSKIPNSAQVAVKGLGLTFIDVVLALTERKDQTDATSAAAKNTLKIYPYSRSGIPMVPRTGVPDLERNLKFFTKENLSVYLNGTKADFEKDLLPLVQQEFAYAYYETAFKNNGVQLKEFTDFESLERQINLFHREHPETERWDWEKMVNPFSHIEKLTHEHVCEYIAQTCQEALLKKGASPSMEAVAVWRKASPLFNKIYSFGGLTAESQEKFDQYYFGVFNRLAYGPPVENMLKILALAKDKIIDFSYVRSPKIEFQNKQGKYKIYNNCSSTSIDFLINATIPRAASKKEKQGLFKNLMERQLLAEFKNTFRGSYFTGAVNITPQGNVIDAKGEVQQNLSCYGTPTEGITFDNDTLSNSRNNFSEYWAAAIIQQLTN